MRSTFFFLHHYAWMWFRGWFCYYLFCLLCGFLPFGA
jgi:hypothetical protein